METALSDQAAERLALMAPFAPLIYLLLILVPVCGVPVLIALTINCLGRIARLVIKPEEKPVTARALLPTVATMPTVTAAVAAPSYTPHPLATKKKKKKKRKPQLPQGGRPGRFIPGSIPPERDKAHLDECATCCGPMLGRARKDYTNIYTSRLQEADDEAHLRFAASQRRVLLTFDSDFVDLAKKMPHAGIIFVKGGPTKANQYELVRMFLELWDEQ